RELRNHGNQKSEPPAVADGPKNILKMNKTDLEIRTKRFALNIIQFVATLPKNKVGDVITHQLVKAGTSVGANYREANRAESRNDFIHKIGIVEKEASETQYWLELCDEAKLGNSALLSALL